jgi:hypothetical protein
VTEPVSVHGIGGSTSAVSRHGTASSLLALGIGGVFFVSSVVAAAHAPALHRSSAAATVVQWIRAVAINDPARACSLMTPRAVDEIHAGSVATCAQAVQAVAATLTGSEAFALRNTSVLQISEAAGTATVAVATIETSDGAGVRFLDQFSILRLCVYHGRWLLSDLVSATPLAGQPV